MFKLGVFLTNFWFAHVCWMRKRIYKHTHCVIQMFTPVIASTQEREREWERDIVIALTSTSAHILVERYTERLNC